MTVSELSRSIEYLRCVAIANTLWNRNLTSFLGSYVSSGIRTLPPLLDGIQK